MVSKILAARCISVAFFQEARNAFGRLRAILNVSPSPSTSRRHRPLDSKPMEHTQKNPGAAVSWKRGDYSDTALCPWGRILCISSGRGRTGALARRGAWQEKNQEFRCMGRTLLNSRRNSVATFKPSPKRSEIWFAVHNPTVLVPIKQSFSGIFMLQITSVGCLGPEFEAPFRHQPILMSIKIATDNPGLLSGAYRGCLAFPD